MESSFHFALLRISIAQIIKAAGFDLSAPSVINTLTEIYIQHLKLTISKSSKFCEQRTNSNEIGVQDISEALIDIGLIKPDEHQKGMRLYGSGNIAKRDSSEVDAEYEYNTKSSNAFKNWVLHSNIFSTSKKLATVPEDVINSLIEKRKIDDPRETDQDRKKRKLRQKQEYYNSFKSNISSDFPNAFEESEDFTAKDLKITWLGYLAEKDMKLGQELKFVHTALDAELLPLYSNESLHPMAKDSAGSVHELYAAVDRNNHTVLTLDHNDKPHEQNDSNTKDQILISPSQELLNTLPYNIHYGKFLTDDILDSISSPINPRNETADNDPNLESEVSV